MSIRSQKQAKLQRGREAIRGCLDILEREVTQAEVREAARFLGIGHKLPAPQKALDLENRSR